MMTDPIADLLTRVRNATRARRDRVEVPWSRLKEKIAQVMMAEGFLGGVAVTGEGKERRLQLGLRYDAKGYAAITGVRRVSKPSLRVYVGVDEIPAVRGGLGITILSTSKGVLVDREARRQQVGGEMLCAVW
jgi:small subunit ribosomal protein S8